ncbi:MULTISPECIES: hypothetical protein [Methylophaga]
MSDIALIIDAVDGIYTKQVVAKCFVTADFDFTSMVAIAN